MGNFLIDVRLYQLKFVDQSLPDQLTIIANSCGAARFMLRCGMASEC
jgi:hypothetical protein